jgi:hypothetical protein
VSVSGDTDAFTIVDNGCPVTLAPAQSCQVAIQLANDEPLQFEGQLHVTDDERSVDASCILRGKVAPAQLSVSGDDEATVYQNGSAQIRLTVHNDGGARTGPISTAVPAGFVVADNCKGLELKGGQSCTLDVGYHAAADDSGDHAVHSVIAAAGATDVIGVDSVFHVKPSTALHVGSLTYHAEANGTFSPPAIVISNVGDHSVSNIKLTFHPIDGSNSYAAVADNCSGQTLQSLGSCTLVVNPLVRHPQGVTDSVTLEVTADGALPGSGRIDYTF